MMENTSYLVEDVLADCDSQSLCLRVSQSLSMILNLSMYLYVNSK